MLFLDRKLPSEKGDRVYKKSIISFSSRCKKFQVQFLDGMGGDTKVLLLNLLLLWLWVIDYYENKIQRKETTQYILKNLNDFSRTLLYNAYKLHFVVQFAIY